MNSFYKNKNVLVTGGAGFIGSHLVEKLVAASARITVLDSFVTGSMENLAAVQHKITIIKDDIRSYDACLQACRNQDYVFHLAAHISVPESMHHPLLCQEVNIKGTYNVLEAARTHSVKRFIFSSSCAVYGQKDTPCAETDACNPTSCYAYSKLIGEQLCKQYARLFSLPTICLRYFNVFGSRQNPHGPYAGVMAQFKEQIIEHKPVTIFGDGLQSRDFVPVETIVKANLLLAQLADDESLGQAINVGTETSTSILDIFNQLKKNIPSYDLKPIFKPAREGDILFSQADCSLLKNMLAKIPS